MTATGNKIGLVLSGGGSRAAYQAGALRAIASSLSDRKESISVIVGSSIGAVNTVILAGSVAQGIDSAVNALNELWKERTYKNTFVGSPTRAFLKSIQVAILRYSSPGPVATSLSIFDPAPLRQRVDQALKKFGCSVNSLEHHGVTAGVMATIEGKSRRPLLFVSGHQRLTEERMAGATFSVSYVPQLTAAHGLASSALPSVLPPVKLDVENGQVRLVDGGICDNIPIDPAVRLGADRIISIDASGRRWWFDHYKEPHDTRPKWEVEAMAESFCFCPSKSLDLMPSFGLGQVLKQTVGRSSRDFIAALGPTWPVFRILKHKMGEALAYEVMSYVALHPGYFEALLDLGYSQTRDRIKEGLSLV